MRRDREAALPLAAHSEETVFCEQVLPRNSRCISALFMLLGALHWLHRHAQAVRTSSWQSAPLKDHVLRRIAVRLAAPAEHCEPSRTALIQESRTDAKHEHETRRRTRKQERVCARGLVGVCMCGRHVARMPARSEACSLVCLLSQEACTHRFAFSCSSSCFVFVFAFVLGFLIVHAVRMLFWWTPRLL